MNKNSFDYGVAKADHMGRKVELGRKAHPCLRMVKNDKGKKSEHFLFQSNGSIVM